MTKWSETRKAMFKWNQYVRIYVDGEQVTDTVQVRDTEQYGEYEVDEMFGHNKVTRVMLVTPEADDEQDDEKQRMTEMTNFNYKPIYPTREITEQHIAAIINERKALSGELYDAIDEKFGSEFGSMMFKHLGELLDMLRDDIKYFDAIDAAMEQAVK